MAAVPPPDNPLQAFLSMEPPGAVDEEKSIQPPPDVPIALPIPTPAPSTDPPPSAPSSIPPTTLSTRPSKDPPIHSKRRTEDEISEEEFQKQLAEWGDRLKDIQKTVSNEVDQWLDTKQRADAEIGPWLEREEKEESEHLKTTFVTGDGEETSDSKLSKEFVGHVRLFELESALLSFVFVRCLPLSPPLPPPRGNGRMFPLPPPPP